jgi:hypothetical protein
LTRVTYVYFALMAIAVFLPEIVLGLAMASGVRELHGVSSWLDNSNWTYAVMYAWIFSLLFGSAFVLGGIARAGIVTVKNSGAIRDKALLWAAVALCLAVEFAHWHGYVGPYRITKM